MKRKHRILGKISLSSRLALVLALAIWSPVHALAWLIALCATIPGHTFAADHTNMESGIPTSLEDIEPVERNTVEFQIVGRYLRLAGNRNTGELESRLVWGAFEKTQLGIAAPLQFGQPEASGNGDIVVNALRKLWDDSSTRLWPGVALALDVRLPTGKERAGFDSGVAVEPAIILTKSVGRQSFHLNLAHEWVGSQSTEEQLRKNIWRVVVGHHVPLTDRMGIVTDVVWQQADTKHTTDIVLLETGIRAQVTKRLIAAIGIGAGLNRGPETPRATATAGLQWRF